MNASFLQAESLDAGYGERCVLDDVSVSIPPGQLTAIGQRLR